METIKSFKGLPLDTIKSFKGYGKVNEADDREFRRKTRKRLIIIAVSAVLLVAIVGIIIGVMVSKHGNNASSSTTPSDSIKAMCSVTRYPDSCYSSISSAKGANLTNDPEELFKFSLTVAADALSKISALTDTFTIPSNDKRLEEALKDCKALFDDAIDRLNDSLASMQAGHEEKILTPSKIDDLKTWLSAAVTDQETCLDGFEGTTGDIKVKMEKAMVDSMHFTSNSLAIVAGILGILEKLNFPIHRKLLATTATVHYPVWATTAQRRALLQDSRRWTPNVTVAQDGSGQVKTIKEAIELVPKKNADPFVIRIKEGVYKENVVVDKSKWNVMMFGDGMNKTVIDGSLNFIDGTPTFSTATFVVTGRRFMAKDMGFRNSAGPQKHQAVALRAGSDRSVFYRCSFDGFQDTLYAHSLRQFYRECDIIGTVDFIFGDASVIFQDCRIMPREPLPNQMNTITAQGKKDPNENTGISIQGCTITPYDKLTRPTYLGRPWKDYSTTIVMQSEIGAVVDPAGWLPWVLGMVPPDTISYAEYQNTGPGSSVAGRVTWPGYKPAISADEANKYTVESFLKGSDWIPEGGVEFQSNLGSVIEG
ncbi:pectinesterase 3 isoform X2 [Elaeis guineensis]|uniref:Pectinesterase n=1 Tax=Elaeis guineensis var. tenera TaxID=51953 RepID=A0A6I9QYD3_ELAGV|nr:pectinesterase 3 isoform X2 [Elaeis guineensis]